MLEIFEKCHKKICFLFMSVGILHRRIIQVWVKYDFTVTNNQSGKKQLIMPTRSYTFFAQTILFTSFNKG